ncbi:VPLPA-CTERM sorting domain-containing protein [uncultured Roseobacter sp.]|uniref:VPLPA-CTERM sorting domain-containing protein n=1 Tax=uncultured Roseobacter sp. TaxID=114847 RepID=UPI00261DC167|nr:VPLPA-CTERM sorting domain-containing protein [uncultured Roseobacter sp.]
MNGFFRAAAVAVLAITGAQTASAASLVMDFEDLEANLGNGGAWTSYEFAGRTFGISWSGGSTEGANIFDTNCPVGSNATSDCGNDEDIVPGGVAGSSSNGVSGNVLIRQRNSDADGDLANDRANTGSITFTLLSGGPLSWLGASAIDDGRFSFSSSTSSEGDFVLGVIAGLADSEAAQLTFATQSPFLQQNDSFSILFEGSGAVDRLVFDDGMTAVPVPAALPLMLAGLGGFGLVARRRKLRKN